MIGVGFIRKYSETFFKDKSASDVAQVLAGSATVTVYKQGATVAFSASVLVAGTNVQVRSIGKLAVLDLVQLGTDATKQMEVVSITDNQHIRLRSLTGSAITILSSQRLVIYSTLPTLYTEASGVSTLANPTTTNSKGYVEFYTPEAKFDLIISGSGLTTTLYIDNQGGWTYGTANWVNAKDYSTIQAAIDAVTTDPDYGYNGGIVYIPAGDYTATTTPSFTTIAVPSFITLLGDGRYATRLLRASGDNTTHLLTHTANGSFAIKNMTIEGTGTAGAAEGLNCAAASGFLSKILLEEVYFNNTSSWAVSMTAAAGSYIDQCRFDRLHCEGAKSGGSINLAGPGTNILTFISCQFNGPGFGTYGADSMSKGCVHLNGGVNINFNGCSFQPQNNGTCLSIDNSVGDVYSIGLHQCHFEGGTGISDVNDWYITTQRTIWHLSIRNCTFVRTPTSSKPRILKSGPTTGWLQFCSIRDCFVTHDEPSASTDDIVLGHVNDHLILDNMVVRKRTGGTFREASASASRNWFVYVHGQYPYPQIRLPAIDFTAITDPRSGAVCYDTTNNKLKLYESAAWNTVQTYGTAVPTLPDNTTPSVKALTYAKCSPAGGTTITNFTDGVAGQQITIIFTNGSATLSDAATLKLSAAITGTADDTITLVYDGTNWFEVARSVN